jgi:hypothetical protein
MGYEGGDLRDLFKPATTDAPTRRALRNVAQAAGEEMTERAARHTPKRTGDLARKWRSIPVTETPSAAHSGTENPDFRARLLEHGVGPHALRPKDADALATPEGPRGGARHPGFAGRHMLARAVAEVDAELPAIARPHLERWAREIETEAAKHPGIERT